MASSAFAPQALDADPLDVDAGRGHDARLEAAMRAKPDNVTRLRLQRTRDGERRIDVSTGAASHDEYGRSRDSFLAATSLAVDRLRVDSELVVNAQ